MTSIDSKPTTVEVALLLGVTLHPAPRCQPDCQVPTTRLYQMEFFFACIGTIVPSIPKDSFPVDVTSMTTHQRVAFTQMSPFPTVTELLPTTTVSQLIEQVPPSLQQLVKHVHTMAHDGEIHRWLELQQPIYLTSDGSAIPGRASYGWILQIGSMKIARGKDRHMEMTPGRSERKATAWQAHSCTCGCSNGIDHLTGTNHLLTRLSATIRAY